MNVVTDGIRAILDGAAGRTAFEKEYLASDTHHDPWVQVMELLVYK